MTMQRDVHDELRARLHRAAAEHEPDRARILARVERGMAGPARTGSRAARPPVPGWVRVVSATAAVAGVLGVGGYAVASAVREDAPPQTVAVSPSPTPSPSPDETSRAPAPPADPAPSGSPSAGRPDRPASRPPVVGAGAGVENGPLWSDGSVDPHSNEFWAQSNVTLRTSQELTALTVQLRIAQTGGVTSTGAWRSLPEADFTLSVGERDGFLVYTWTLKEGRRVPAGEWMFAGQYDHERGGRDAGGDSYGAAATAGPERLTVGGDFAPRGDKDAGGGDS